MVGSPAVGAASLRLRGKAIGVRCDALSEKSGWKRTAIEPERPQACNRDILRESATVANGGGTDTGPTI